VNSAKQRGNGAKAITVSLTPSFQILAKAPTILRTAEAFARPRAFGRRPAARLAASPSPRTWDWTGFPAYATLTIDRSPIA
jgi:hypothetical protein